jgi:hypothetical protein
MRRNPIERIGEKGPRSFGLHLTLRALAENAVHVSGRVLPVSADVRAVVAAGPSHRTCWGWRAILDPRWERIAVGLDGLDEEIEESARFLHGQVELHTAAIEHAASEGAFFGHPPYTKLALFCGLL